jgi:25S rRNA (uracil2634-N3)-methyltransferase
MEKRLKRIRQYDDIFVHSDTLTCTLSGCVPCLYKINPSGLWFDEENDNYLIVKENQRPEMCPRSNSSTYRGLYNQRMNILTLGDGDFSFSLSICKGLKPKYAKHLVSTSYESYKTVRSTYLSAHEHILELQSLGSQVLHNVDACQLSEGNLPEFKFDRVVWNFPCVAAQNGLDGQATELQLNIDMMKSFFQNVGNVLKQLPDSGSEEASYPSEVHITHKTIEPFSWWHMEDIAKSQGFALIGKIVFDRLALQFIVF